MDARKFIDKYGKDEATRVAESAGSRYVYLTQIASGHRKPSPKLARRLVEVSKGRLTLRDLRPDIWTVG